MARYIDADKFKSNLEKAIGKMHLIGGVKAVDVGAVIKALDMQPTADVVPREELDAMRGAANSYKMHYEEAKQEADRLAVELEAEKTLRVVRIERIFEEIEKEGAIFEGAHETTCYFPNGFFAKLKKKLKKKYLPGGDGDGR